MAFQWHCFRLKVDAAGGIARRAIALRALVGVGSRAESRNLRREWAAFSNIPNAALTSSA
jgi:hypothetical protein